jgi:hypothetical protein
MRACFLSGTNPNWRTPVLQVIAKQLTESAVGVQNPLKTDLEWVLSMIRSDGRGKLEDLPNFLSDSNEIFLEKL